jgi:hypothetical protein
MSEEMYDLSQNLPKLQVGAMRVQDSMRGVDLIRPVFWQSQPQQEHWICSAQQGTVNLE